MHLLLQSNIITRYTLLIAFIFSLHGESLSQGDGFSFTLLTVGIFQHSEFDDAIFPKPENITNLDLMFGYASTATKIYKVKKDIYVPFWEAPKGRNIKKIDVKTDNIFDALVLLDDGSVYILDYDAWFNGSNNYVKKLEYAVGYDYSSNWGKVKGDALYLTSTYNVYVTRDTGTTWQLDTIGLGANFSRPRDIDLDSAQYVYLAHENGLFKQHPDSNVWNKLTSFPSSSANAVYVDRTDKIFATSGSNLYYSTDYGATWTLNTTGLEASSITKFGEDIYGNVYGTNGSKIFRSTGGTESWTRIDAGITAIAVNPTTINAIDGDSVLLAATNFGMFASTDQGITWSSSNKGIRPENFFGFAKTNDYRLIASTDQGIFHLSSGDSLWLKSYPTSGYLGGISISRDGLGNLYIHKNNGNALSVYKSIDGGLIWNADTAGISSTKGDVFIIDEQGNQHRATNSYGGSFYAMLYVKPYGGNWQLDTAGFISSNYNAANVMGSDKNGNIYVSGIYGGKKVWRRSAGGSWTIDSAGITSSVNYFERLTSFPNGDMVGASGYYLLQRNFTTGIWSTMPMPSSLSSPQVVAISVDSNGTLLASFKIFSGTTIYKGVYSTTNRGADWTYRGLDSINVNQLISYGDTTYALTDGRGMYAIGLGGGGETTYSLTTNAVNGSITRSPNQTTYTSGSSVELTAVADSGFHFTNWSGDVPQGGSSTNPLTVVMEANKTITANFEVNSSSVTNQYNYNSRWNLVSVPLDVVNDSALILFPTRSAGPFSYQGTYNQEAVLANGKGYWMKFPSATIQSITGTTLTTQEISVSTGWNLLGSISSSVAVTNITSNPPGLTTSSFFSYNGRYATSNTIEPGKGYWVKVNSAGTLMLSSLVNGHLSLGKIKIVPTNELPPPSPEGDGNIEYSNNSIIPSEYALEQNFPNPFNPSTVIRYQLPVDSWVTLKVYNILGEEVATLVDEFQEAGFKSQEWIAESLPSGVYVYRLNATHYGGQAGTFIDVKRLVLIK